ncbi:MAG: hemerythrin domain-containing protein [Clostridia bacterium]|nr:hemerythrin domain-containing protein [Clostridia bacterium]
MDGITLMMEEHRNIERMLAVVRKACAGVLNGDSIDFTDFESMMDFIKNYADLHHHGKEEKFLFTKMIDEMGGAAEKLVRNGMLVEHDLGRLFMMELKEALERVKAGEEDAKLDVIAHAVSYTHLLARHINKEDHAAYPFAKRGLSEATLAAIDHECEVFEKEQAESGIQKKYLDLLEALENKYLR